MSESVDISAKNCVCSSTEKNVDRIDTSGKQRSTNISRNYLFLAHYVVLFLLKPSLTQELLELRIENVNKNLLKIMLYIHWRNKIWGLPFEKTI